MQYKILNYIFFALFTTATQANAFGVCNEGGGTVSPACLYNEDYPSCQLSDEQYEQAQENAWQFQPARFSDQQHINTGKSQDLGHNCRFYFRIRPELGPMGTYQWLVYIDKSDLKATHMEPVVW